MVIAGKTVPKGERLKPERGDQIGNRWEDGTGRGKAEAHEKRSGNGMTRRKPQEKACGEDSGWHGSGR